MAAQEENSEGAYTRREVTAVDSFPGVFINAPFDRAYEPLFATLVCTLICLRFRPHCVLEVRERGEGRLKRIYQVIEACPTSIHDMSRCGVPARFNMPFELGLACAIQLSDPARYDIVVMDRHPYRADRTLRDYKGHDLLIHGGTCDGMVMALVDVFSTGHSDAAALRHAGREVRQRARIMKRDHRAATLFRRHLFQELISAASNVARAHGFLAP